MCLGNTLTAPMKKLGSTLNRCTRCKSVWPWLGLKEAQKQASESIRQAAIQY